MDLGRQQEALRELKGKNRRQGAVNSVLALAILIETLVLISVVGTERTVLIPPNISKTFWVTSSKASGTYLEEMGSFISWLILDVSPATIDWKKDTLLNFVSPDDYGTIQKRQDVEADRLKRLNASTQFLPMQVVADETNQAVVIRGRMKTQINGQETSSESRAYLAEFQYAGGRIHLKTFKELPNDKQDGTQVPAMVSGAVRASN